MLNLEVQHEEGSKKPKHVAESSEFTKLTNKNVVLDYTTLYYLINRETHNEHSLP